MLLDPQYRDLVVISGSPGLQRASNRAPNLLHRLLGEGATPKGRLLELRTSFGLHNFLIGALESARPGGSTRTSFGEGDPKYSKGWLDRFGSDCNGSGLSWP